jgi:hypothetical protein
MRRFLLLLASTLLFGCPSDDSAPKLFPAGTIYSGADPAGGGATYKVTIAASEASGITWTSADETVASVTGTDTLGTVTAKKPGSTMITATAGGKATSIPLTVNSYAAADLTAGTAVATQYTCTKAGCHGPGDNDISPSGIGKHTDAELLTAVTTGVNPEGGQIDVSHSFAVTANSAMSRGICAYMRQLPPGTPVQDE